MGDSARVTSIDALRDWKEALCVFQHDAQRHSMMKVPSRDALRVTRQPYDELIRVCDVFVCGATAAHPIQV